jgi:PAS domain S-box-containing protein
MKIYKPDYEELERIAQMRQGKIAELDRLFSIFPDLICIAGRDGFFKYLNTVWEKTLGYSLNELFSKPILDFVHPDDHELTRKEIEKQINGISTLFFENRYICKDGTYKTLEWRATPSIGGNLYAIARDISERKRVDRLLRESENQFRQLVELLPVAVYSCDISGTILHYNHAAVKLWGAEPRTGERFCGSHKIYLPDGTPLPRERCPMAETLRTGKPVQNAEIVFERPDGSRVTSIVNTTSITNTEGKFVGAINTLLDLNDLKMAEEALLESKTRYQTLVKTIPDLVWLKDIHGVYLSCNHTFERLFGAREADIVGKTDYDFTDKEQADFFREHDRKALEEDGPSVNEEWLTFAADGHSGLFETIKTPMRDAEGHLLGVLGIARDITERKHAADEKARIEAQLSQAQKMESVGRLAGGVAHDFNNMLSIIIGFTDMAMDTIDPAHPIIADLEEIRKAANRSADLTRHLLAFARKQTIAPRVLDLNETVEGILKMLRRLIGEDIDLIWRPGTDLWPVKIDPSQVDQILANLCVNARDAITGVGNLIVETGNSTLGEEYCTVHAGFVPGEYVKIAVSDTGCGMDKETLSRIFEPFFTTKAAGKGTGLGLSTVYGAVKQNNGFVNVYSEPGQGTTFSIYLPRYMGMTGQARAGAAGPSMGGHETILLVEDEPTILTMTTKMLQLLGYKVLAAGSPHEAIRLAGEHSGGIHLLVTDVVMPGMNGRDLAKKLLADYSHLKCLFMSGYTSDVIAQHGILGEGVQFIQKPFSKKELAVKVRTALEQKLEDAT